MGNDSKSLELQIRIAVDDALRAVSSLKDEMGSLAAEAKKLSESDGKAIAETFKQTQAAAEKAAASMKLFGSSSEELRKVQSQLKTAAVDLVAKGFDPQSTEVKKLIEEYKRLGKEAADLDKAAGKNVQSFGDLQSAMMRLAEVAALAKALSVIKDMGEFALKTADSFQTARNQFGTLLGDMEAGAGLFNEIKAFNDKTPFNLDTLTQATNVLIAAKVPLKDLQSQLTKFGDLAQGNSQKMTSYVNAFSQAAAKGKADMQVLNTYLHQGVPILDALAKNFGVATAEIVEMSGKGQISFTDFQNALNDLTAAGGQYFGGMEKASKSLEAMQEGLRESVNSLAASFGEMLLPAATGFLGVLTELSDAINGHPVVKGILAGALVAVTGYMAAMAVKAVALAAKTWLAQAAQMGLNASLAVTNPLLIAGIAAAGAATVAYVAFAAKQQQAANEAANFTYRQMLQNEVIDSTSDSIRAFIEALNAMSDSDLYRNIRQLNNEIGAIARSLNELDDEYSRAMESGNESWVYEVLDRIEEEEENLARARTALNNAQSVLGDRRTNWIDSMFGDTQAGKIEKINGKLAAARTYLSDPDLGSGDRSKLQEIIQNLNAELERLGSGGNGIDRMAARWKEAWADVWNKFRAGQSVDPFANIELERGKKLADAWDNYVRTANYETIDQVNAYYDAQRSEIIRQLADEEARTQRELTRTKVDDLEYEKQKALEALKELMEKRVFAAQYTGEDIQTIRETFGKMLNETELQFEIKIKKTELEEAREAVRDWQQELSDSLTLALMNLEDFNAGAAVILGDLSARLIELSASAALSGFEEFGRALGEAEKGSEALERALANTAQQILNQLPAMFLQAGLQLIANGQWPLGLGFIAAAGSSAIISGYVDGASKHAQGGVFDEYGTAARAFAAGGAFTNQIVSTPTYFQHGGGPGLMGEAGPEAILPLTRMPSGNLGVETTGGGAVVTVNIINNSGAEVSQEEKTNDDGSKQIDVIIGSLVNSHIASGKADRVMGSRFGLRAAGV